MSKRPYDALEDLTRPPTHGSPSTHPRATVHENGENSDLEHGEKSKRSRSFLALVVFGSTPAL